MKYILLLILLTLILANQTTLAQETEIRTREYTVDNFHDDLGGAGTVEVVVNATPFRTNTDIDISKSHTSIHAFSYVSHDGSSTRFGARVLIDGIPIGNIDTDCVSSMVSDIGGGATNPARGHAYMELRCDIPLQQDLFTITFNEFNTNNVNFATVGATITNTEVYNHTLPETELPPAIESGAFVRNSLEYTHSINNTHIEAPITDFTLSRNIPERNLDSVLLRNESDSTLLIHYSISAVASPGDSNADFTITVPGNPTASPCKITVSGEVQGTAKGGTLSCRLSDYQDGFTEVDVTVSDPDNTLKATSFSAEIRQTETRLVPLMPQTVTLEPFASILPLLIFGLLIAAAEWKRDPLYYILSGILGLLITINLPTFLPEYTRIFLVAVSLYLILRAYLSYSDARMNTDVMDET